MRKRSGGTCTEIPGEVKIGEDEYEEVFFEVEGDVTPPTPGCRRGHPDNWTPDEPGEIDITGAWKLDGSGGKRVAEVELNDLFEACGGEDRVEEALIEAFNGDWEAAKYDAAEARYEARCDRELFGDDY
jgi:hypothetical protein